MEKKNKNAQSLLRNRASQYGTNENGVNETDVKVDITKADIFKTNNSSYGSSYGS